MSAKLPADAGRGLQEPQLVIGTLDLNQVWLDTAQYCGTLLYNVVGNNLMPLMVCESLHT